MLVQIFKNYSSSKSRLQPKGKNVRKEVEIDQSIEEDDDGISEKYEELKKQFILIQKREEYTRNTLVESQVK